MFSQLKLTFRAKITGYIVVFILTCVSLNIYFLNKYRVGSLDLDKVVFSSTINKNDLLIYTKPYRDSDIDFKVPIQPTIEGDNYAFSLGKNKIRTFRIYFGRKIEKGLIQNIKLIDENNNEITTDISHFERNGISIIDKNKNSLAFSGELNSFLELKYERISQIEFIFSELIILFIAILVSIILLYIWNNSPEEINKNFNFRTFFVSIFFGSLFLPIPIFNITFMLAFLLVLRDFDSKLFLKNRAGLLFVLYFLIFITNNFFISVKFNMALTETLLPILFLPFFFACIPRSNYFRSIVLSVFLISLFLISTSVLDVAIYHNMNYFSFDAFSKYLHPVYFSYVLFFALMYIQLYLNESFSKKIFIPVLFFALICCGSKLIIGLTLMFYVVHFMRKQIYLGYVFAAVVIAAVFLFSPTKKRFQEAFSYKSLTVLNEYPVPSVNDPRLTGLTLRLIIWQESLKSVSGLKEVFFGKGVDNLADKELEDRLIARGLERRHTKYDPHNQFITTYYKFGFIGFVTLLSVCLYCFSLAIKRKNELLFFSTVLFSTAMLTESVLQRVVGIYFFICILLLLSVQIINSTQNIENSDTRNEGNT